MRYFRILFPLFFSLIISGCFDTEESKRILVRASDMENWNCPAYGLYSRKIRHTIDSLRKIPEQMYADKYTKNYYAAGLPFIWITRSGVNTQADSLLSCIEQLPAYGISGQCFYIEEIKEDLRRIRHLDFNADNAINTVFGRVEYRLTQAMLRYCCGQHYGYTRPDRLFNHLDPSDTTPNAPFKILYDIPTEYADDTFAQKAIDAQKSGSLSAFLQSVQPDHPAYSQLTKAYQKETSAEIKEKLSANIERCRWKTDQPKQKYVWINLAGMNLLAVNTSKGDTLEMKVCGGSFKHKSPMLASKIERMDLNPYWIIPYSIIKKEIAPRHAQDEAYFSRNRIRIFDKQTGKELDPLSVTASMLTSGNYRLQQDNGDGNSLGRIIFRFPNNFSVFLHDTDNKAAFKRYNRAVSHGCIRVEAPFKLALFLWENQDEKAIDELRMEIGLPPLYTRVPNSGKDKEDKNTPLKVSTRKFNLPTPVFIHYYTAYPDVHAGINYYPDIYKYDEILLKKLKAL